jgi:excisionase family DNA binding protein
LEIKDMEVYSIDEACRYLKVSSSTLSRMIKNKQIQTAKVGKQHRILGKEILRLVLPETQAGEARAKVKVG